MVWYPLRRAGTFERLTADEQRIILLEHGGIGRAFGKAGLGHDIRLACFGLDKNDNDFVIGLLGSKLYPLSAIVQRMRKTKQTSLHIEHMGPFFVGKRSGKASDVRRLAMRMLVRLDRMLRHAVLVRLLGRVLVAVVFRFPQAVDVGMGMIVRMGMRVLMGMHHAAMRMLVAVDVRVLVNVRVIVLDLVGHDTQLLKRT